MLAQKRSIRPSYKPGSTGSTLGYKRSCSRPRQRSEQIKNETEAKVQAMQEKAAKAQGTAKAAINARVTEFKKQYEQWVERAKSMVA